MPFSFNFCCCDKNIQIGGLTSHTWDVCIVRHPQGSGTIPEEWWNDCQRSGGPEENYLLYTWAFGSHACLHKIYARWSQSTFQCGRERGSWPPPQKKNSGGTMDSSWLLGKEKSVFIKVMDSCRLILLWRMTPHSGKHEQHKLDLTSYYF